MDKAVIFIVFDKDNRGPLVLYEMLVEKGYGCKFVYFLEHGAAEMSALREFICGYDTPLICFSFASHSVSAAFGLADFLKREFPDVPLVCGGVHPTIAPEPCLAHFDAVCVGEGEHTIMELAEKAYAREDFSKASNLVYLEDGEIIHNPVAPLVTDLDSLPVRRLFTEDHFVVSSGKVRPMNLGLYQSTFTTDNIVYTQTFARGCPFSCTYCCNSKYKEIYPKWSRLRSKSVAGSIHEIKEAIKLNPGIVKVFIVDDCFLAHDIEWLREFTESFKKEINKTLNFFTIPGYVKKDKLELFRDVDMAYVSMGLQSGSTRTGEIYKRPLSIKQFLQACGAIRAAGFGLVINIILDNPWEEEEDFFQTLDVLTRIPKPFYIVIYSLKVYPGTRLWSYLKESGGEIPAHNVDYADYNIIKATDVNRLIILTQFLPGKAVIYLFRRRSGSLARLAIRLFYLPALVSMPFHALRVAGSKYFMTNVRIALGSTAFAKRIVKGLFGIK